MTQQRDYAFARRPKWLAGHVLALLAVIVFVNMGFWQMRRLSDRQDFNALLMSRTTIDEIALDEALNQFGPSQDSLELRAVVASGEYRQAEEVILIAKSYNGLSGHHVLTPLYLEDGRAVLVDRGWVPIDLDEPGMAVFAPPGGTVQVHGALRKTEVRGSVGPVTPADGVLTQIARPNLERLDSQVEAELLPVYIQLLTQNPAQGGDYPALVPLPQPSEGSHRGYAVQWFLFAAVTVVGYPILLRRTAEERSEPAS
jgi:surfeit locus 1 family protein